MSLDDIVVVETSVWVDYFARKVNPQTSWLRQHVETNRVATVDLILCEVLQGIRDHRSHALILARLSGLIIFDTGGEELALQSAKHYRSLRKRGITIRSTIDCLIATFCIRQVYSLLHNDRDFDPFEEHLGLTVVHPSSLPLH